MRRWLRTWEPAGGWKALIAVCALVAGFGVGGVVAYAQLTTPVPPRIIEQPVTHTSTRYLTQPALITAPARIAPPSARDTGLEPVTPPVASPSPRPDPTTTTTEAAPSPVPSDTGSPLAPTPGVSTPSSPPQPEPGGSS